MEGYQLTKKSAELRWRKDGYGHLILQVAVQVIKGDDAGKVTWEDIPVAQE